MDGRSPQHDPQQEFDIIASQFEYTAVLTGLIKKRSQPTKVSSKFDSNFVVGTDISSRHLFFIIVANNVTYLSEYSYPKFC